MLIPDLDFTEPPRKDVTDVADQVPNIIFLKEKEVHLRFAEDPGY